MHDRSLPHNDPATDETERPRERDRYDPAHADPPDWARYPGLTDGEAVRVELLEAQDAALRMRLGWDAA